jgi:hypothetical protein
VAANACGIRWSSGWRSRPRTTTGGGQSLTWKHHRAACCWAVTESGIAALTLLPLYVTFADCCFASTYGGNLGKGLERTRVDCGGFAPWGDDIGSEARGSEASDGRVPGFRFSAGSNWKTRAQRSSCPRGPSAFLPSLPCEAGWCGVQWPPGLCGRSPPSIAPPPVFGPRWLGCPTLRGRR